jgi:hypothetical protein
LFSDFVFYIDDKEPLALPGVDNVADPTSSLALIPSLIRIYGGVVSAVLDECVALRVLPAYASAARSPVWLRVRGASRSHVTHAIIDTQWRHCQCVTILLCCHRTMPRVSCSASATCRELYPGFENVTRCRDVNSLREIRRMQLQLGGDTPLTIRKEWVHACIAKGRLVSCDGKGQAPDPKVPPPA